MFGTRGAGHLAILFFLAVLAGCGGEGRTGGKGGSGGNEPLACQTQADCPSEQPFCQAGFCAGCLDDTHCEDDRPICREGACSPCVDSSECSKAGTLPMRRRQRALCRLPGGRGLPGRPMR